LKVVFDSSFLMAVVEHPTTWFEDMTDMIGKFQPVMLDCVLDEMRRLAAGEGKRARFARVALELAGGFTVERCGGGRPDDEILSAAQEGQNVVATVDSTMAKALRALGVKVVSLRGGRVAFL
jgi:rRNA-processing protein FCF1